jgi:hypothetical protein
MFAQGFSALPRWAEMIGRMGAESKPPADADAWVLYQKTEFAYSGDGEILKHQYRVVRVLTDRGISEGTFALSGLGGRTSQVKKLLGWNIRPDGEVSKLDTDEAITIGAAGEPGHSTRVLTAAQLDRVMQGSIIAFESLERVRMPQGPIDLVEVMEEHPIRQWELSLAKSGGWFRNVKEVQLRLDTRHFDPWIHDVEANSTSLTLRNVPALPKEEALHPYGLNVLPQVYIAFLDPKLVDAPGVSTWDEYARWTNKIYSAKAVSVEPIPLKGLETKVAMQSTVSWMSKELIYKQVYLTPERGWIPESSEEVLRRRYGDCKDLTSCFAGALRSAGIPCFPALARIVEGRVEPDAPVNPYIFNHVITAVRIEKSLGLPAEIDTSKGRFLLVDPTSRFTPLGLLPAVHRGGKVMICIPEGAIWADIPTGALEEQALQVVLKGKVGNEGLLEAEVVVAEVGDVASLRSECLNGQVPALKQRLIDLLGLSAGADIQVVKSSDGWNLLHPFEVQAKLRVPRALTSSGGEYSLGQFGFPGVPAAVQKGGRPRMYPIESLSALHWALRLEVELPIPVELIVAQKKIETSFRTATWEAALSGRLLKGSFTQKRQDAKFDFEHREEGVAQAKKDRSQLKALLDDATSFKPKL